MAVKRYRNKLEIDPSYDVDKQIRVGVDEAAGFTGGGPGDEFDFDFDRPGFHEQPLLDAGVIEVVSDKSGKKE